MFRRRTPLWRTFRRPNRGPGGHVPLDRLGVLPDGDGGDGEGLVPLLHAVGVAPIALAVAPGELAAAVVVGVVGAVFAPGHAFGPVVRCANSRVPPEHSTAKNNDGTKLFMSSIIEESRDRDEMNSRKFCS